MGVDVAQHLGKGLSPRRLESGNGVCIEGRGWCGVPVVGQLGAKMGSRVVFFDRVMMVMMMMLIEKLDKL